MKQPGKDKSYSSLGIKDSVIEFLFESGQIWVRGKPRTGITHSVKTIIIQPVPEFFNLNLVTFDFEIAGLESVFTRYLSHFHRNQFQLWTHLTAPIGVGQLVNYKVGFSRPVEDDTNVLLLAAKTEIIKE